MQQDPKFSRMVRDLMHRLDDERQFQIANPGDEAVRFQISAATEVLFLVRDYSQNLSLALAPCLPNLTPQAEEKAAYLTDRLCDSLYAFGDPTPNRQQLFSDELSDAKSALFQLRSRYDDIKAAVGRSSALKSYKCPITASGGGGTTFLSAIRMLLALVHLAERYADVTSGWGPGEGDD
jgi:hypothetical protein